MYDRLNNVMQHPVCVIVIILLIIIAIIIIIIIILYLYTVKCGTAAQFKGVHTHFDKANTRTERTILKKTNECT